MTRSTEQIVAALRSRSYLAASEHELHEGIASSLAAAGIAFEREVRLDARSRVDFLTGDGIGIEVKVAGSVHSVVRQLARYAEHDRVRALVLATTTVKHWPLCGCPSTGGKPLAIAWLGGLA